MVTHEIDSDGLDPTFLQEVSGIIKMLGHTDRLRIVECLRYGEKRVSEIQQQVGLSQPVTSQHLRQMKDRGIVDNRRDGACVLYSVTNPLIHKMLACLAETQAQMRGGA